jgi:hypothetical protein
VRRYIFLAGVATGYVLGARGGRGHYERIKTTACKIRDSRAAHQATDTAVATGGKLLNTAMDKAPGWVPGSHTDETYVNGREASPLRP